MTPRGPQVGEITQQASRKSAAKANRTLDARNLADAAMIAFNPRRWRSGACSGPGADCVGQAAAAARRWAK